MKNFSVWYRYNGRTCEFRFQAEDFEQARERVIVFKASKEDAANPLLRGCYAHGRASAILYLRGQTGTARSEEPGSMIE